jgi:hypothetical protein
MLAVRKACAYLQQVLFRKDYLRRCARNSFSKLLERTAGSLFFGASNGEEMEWSAQTGAT